MQTMINKEWVYEQSPAEIWTYLTDADLLGLWLMPNNFKLVEGHSFQFTIKPIPSLNLDGIAQCKVLEIVPLKKLVYSWKAGPGDGSFPLDTIVEWRLEPEGDGTKLFLQQSGFKEINLDIFKSMTGGWQKLLQKLSEQFKTVQ